MRAPTYHMQERQTDYNLFASLTHYIYIVHDQLHTKVFNLPAKTKQQESCPQSIHRKTLSVGNHSPTRVNNNITQNATKHRKWLGIICEYQTKSVPLQVNSILTIRQ